MSISSLTADLDCILQGAGVSVVSAASSTSGTLRSVDTLESTDGLQIQKRGTTLLIRTGTIADLAVDLPLTVNGNPYVVRWFDLEGTGALTRILIAEVTS